jgi:large subunit ribosomal protein L25
LPKDLPEFIEVDMLEVEVGTTVHISDITLPANVTSVSLTHEDGDLALATVKAAKGEKADKEGDAAEGEEAGEE